MSVLISAKTIAANVIAGGAGAFLALAPEQVWPWVLSGAVILVVMLSGELFLAAEDKAEWRWKKFLTSLLLKVVYGFVAAIIADGNLRILAVLLLPICVAKRNMLSKPRDLLGVDDKPKGP